jgi:predicted secreted protein
MTRRLVAILLCVISASTVFGGDIAMFENLGFSSDGSVFAFGQYGVLEGMSNPYAELYVVDVVANRFVSGGTFAMSDDAPLTLGQDGRGALYYLMGRAHSLLESRGIEHLTTGRPIYILVNGDEPRERLTFRDFNTSTRYDVHLSQRSRGSDEDGSASFYIDLTLTLSDERVRTFTIGQPGYYRDGVADYRITQIMVGPNEDSVVFVVQKTMRDGSIRYMVETVSL